MDEYEETAALPTSASFTRIAGIAVTAGEIDRLIGLLEQDGNYNQIELALKTASVGLRLSRAELRAVADEHLRQKPELEPPEVPGKHNRRRRIGWLDLLREKQAELRGQAETPGGSAAATAATQVQQEPPPVSDEDDRLRVERAIIQRQGQATFRAGLISAYNGYCAVTGCGEQNVLEAAHIRPYRGPRWNRVTNGLLLRADIHTLSGVRAPVGAWTGSWSIGMRFILRTTLVA